MKRLLLYLMFIPLIAFSSGRSSFLLKKYSDSLRFSRIDSVRSLYNDSFRNYLTEVLDSEKPFDVVLDSITRTISVLNSEDGRIRVISWAYINDKEEYLNHCVVLYRKNKRSTQLVFWMKENNKHGPDFLFEELDEDNWPGAIYYQLYDFKVGKRKYYCVLGLNGRNSFNNNKIIDVLWVDKFGELHIGAPVFYNSETDKKPQSRVFFEYADQATMLLRFERESKMITFSNLVPNQKVNKGKTQYYIPDGRIDFFILKKKGKWIRVEGLSDFKLDGNE